MNPAQQEDRDRRKFHWGGSAKVGGGKCICGWHGREDGISRNGVEGNRKASFHLQSVLGIGGI